VTPESTSPRRPVDERILLAVVLVVFAVLQLAQVSSSLELGNGTYYLRDAIAFADGDVARSRYSPGLPVLLVPVLWLTGSDPAASTVVIEILMVAVAVAALVLTHRVVRRHASRWIALGVVTAFALGQAGLGFLRGINAEPVSLALVAGVVLLEGGGRRGLAAALLTGVAVAVRIALAPFFGILWLLRLRRRPQAASLALVLVMLAAGAHFATGPVADPSYVEIAESIYDGEGGGSGGPVVTIARQVGEGIVTFGRYGVPRLVWPFRILATPIGLVLAIGTLAAMAWGLRRRSGGLRFPVVAGATVYLGLLLLWPIRVTEAVRLVVPVAPVLLAGLAGTLDRVVSVDDEAGSSRLRQLVYGLVAVMAVVGLAAGLSGFVQTRAPSAVESDFFQAHRMAAARTLEGPVVSRKPAVTELMLGVPAIGYPAGDPTVDDLERYAAAWSACVFVVDGLGQGDENLFAWVDANAGDILAAVGATRIVVVDAPWCR